jgi:hypothetical protein
MAPAPGRSGRIWSCERQHLSTFGEGTKVFRRGFLV